MLKASVFGNELISGLINHMRVCQSTKYVLIISLQSKLHCLSGLSQLSMNSLYLADRARGSLGSGKDDYGF